MTSTDATGSERANEEGEVAREEFVVQIRHSIIEPWLPFVVCKTEEQGKTELADYRFYGTYGSRLIRRTIHEEVIE